MAKYNKQSDVKNQQHKEFTKTYRNIVKRYGSLFNYDSLRSKANREGKLFYDESLNN